MKKLGMVLALLAGLLPLLGAQEAKQPAKPETVTVFVEKNVNVTVVEARQMDLTKGDVLFAAVSQPNGSIKLYYTGDQPATIYSWSASKNVACTPGSELMVLHIPGRSKAKVKTMLGGRFEAFARTFSESDTIQPGEEIGTFIPLLLAHESVSNADKGGKVGTMSELLKGLWEGTGISDVIRQNRGSWILGWGKVLMIAVSLVLLYLAIVKGFEPLLLLPIGFGALLSNIPLAGISGPNGLLGMVYTIGIDSGVFPLLIFMGVGAMTDFGPLIANPKTALLGAAAQFGIFFALLCALVLTKLDIGINFDLKDAASIGIIGGADGPTSIFLTSKLSPALLGAVAVAAYSYMALVPIIQPPIMKLLTTQKERKIKMRQLRSVSKIEKICFPILITLLCAALLTDAVPLIGMLMLGNLLKECGVCDRLSNTAQNALMNTVTIFLGLTVGSKLSADQFLQPETLGILLLGCFAFAFATAAGVIFAKVMNLFSKEKINPLIGSAGVSAVPMAARVSNKVGLEADPHNFLLMHAMGPNVAGVIGSAVAAGVLLRALGGL